MSILVDPYSNIENIRQKNPNILKIAQLNINALWNKFNSLVDLLRNNVDILLILVAKIDSSFPTAQFKIGCTAHRLDRNSDVGGISSMPEKTYLPYCWTLNYLWKVF